MVFATVLSRFYNIKFAYQRYDCCIDYFLRDKIPLFFVQFDNYVSRIHNQNNTDQDERGPQRAMGYSVQRYFLLMRSLYFHCGALYLVVELI